MSLQRFVRTGVLKLTSSTAWLIFRFILGMTDLFTAAVAAILVSYVNIIIKLRQI